MKQTGFLIVIALLAFGCSSSGWLSEDRVQEPVIFLHEISKDVIPQNEKRLDDSFWTPFLAKDADSLAHAALLRLVTGISRGQQTGPVITTDISEADYMLRIDQLEISRVFTLNVAHPGPVFRVKTTVSAWQGNRKVFETRQSATANLAYVISNGARFYYPEADEIAAIENQRDTIYPAVVSSLGKAIQEFLER